MASPYWVTGDPAVQGAPIPIRVSGHPEAELYVWDPNPDQIPEGGYPCMIVLHGGGNFTGSGKSSSSAVPLGWSEAAAGDYSWVANAEPHPIMVCPLTYPMGLSTFSATGNARRPVTGHWDGWTAARAAQAALLLIRGKARRGEAPFANINPDLIDYYATSAGTTWAGLAACLLPLSPWPYGESTKVRMLVQSSAAPDINQHIPGDSGTQWMLAGLERGIFAPVRQDAIAASGATYVRPSDLELGEPAAQNVGLHPSWPNEFRRRLADFPELVQDIDILTVYAANSNPTQAPPWRRAHDAGQGVHLHTYLASEPRYTGNHMHLANSQASGAESDDDDALPDYPWAFEWGQTGTPGYQLQWEWITARYAERGFIANGGPTGGNGEPPGSDTLNPPPQGDALALQGGGYYANQTFDGGVLLQGSQSNGGGGGEPTDDAYLLQDGSGWYAAQGEGRELEVTTSYYLLQSTSEVSGGFNYLTQDGQDNLVTQEGPGNLLLLQDQS